LYPLEDGSEQFLRYRDLGHLKDNVSRMANYLILAFLDALFRSSSMVVEMDDVLLAPTEVSDNEPWTRGKNSP
jgi:hypothetical protein